jgi:hypothetical protein
MNKNKKQSGYCKIGLNQAAPAVASCEKFAVAIEQAKEGLVQEFGGQLAGHESVLRLALNEAEALAWETNYPHLVFATLAMEKAQAAANWENRQQWLQGEATAFEKAGATLCRV